MKKHTADVKKSMAILEIENEIIKIIAHADGRKDGTVARLLLSLGIAQWVRTGSLTDQEFTTPLLVARAAADKIRKDAKLSEAMNYLKDQADKPEDEDRLL